MDILGILGKLGFDWQVALANLFNFLLIFFILKKLLFSSISKAINDRNEKINQGIKDAEKAKEDLLSADKEKHQILSDAREEMSDILKKAKKEAGSIKEEILRKAHLEASATIEQGKKALEQEKEKVMLSAKNELAQIVVQATEKILVSLPPNINEKIAEDAISSFRK